MAGLLIRKSRMPFSNLVQIDRADIDDYASEVNRSRYSETCLLVITRRSTGKKYYLDLSDLDSGHDVLNAVKKNLKNYNK